jgi:hypothetical protein
MKHGLALGAGGHATSLFPLIWVPLYNVFAMPRG